MHTTRSRHTRHRSGVSRHGNTHSRFRGHRSHERHRSSYTHSGHAQNSRRSNKKASFDPSQFINTNPLDEAAETFAPKHTFGDFGLDGRLLHTLRTEKHAEPTPIQDQVIPHILENRDVVGIAETGTGKTAAFLLPLIQKTLREYRRQTLVVTPTRELAIQIEQELKKLSHGLKIYATVCVGGANIRPQIHGLRRQNHFIIGTPGRLLDLLEHRHLNLRTITTVVLDEADRMLDMGFINPIQTILKEIPAERETLFFSATMDERTKKLVHDFLRDPVTVSVKKRDAAQNIKQDVVRHDHLNKFETLVTLLSGDAFRKVIIFGAMKHSVEKLAKKLSTEGLSAESIHGNKSHSQRQRALTNFKNGKAKVLVATDVAARGIHVDNVSHVINYDLPNTFEDYIHRIGRTGRGNRRGEALTFISN